MDKQIQSLNKHAIGMIILCIVQYLFGMYTSLFIEFPENGSSKTLWEFASNQMPVVLHIIFGFLLLLGTLVLVIRSLVLKDKNWTIASILALISIIGAIIGGAIFVPTQQDTYSFLMAVCFIAALIAFFWGLYTSKSKT